MTMFVTKAWKVEYVTVQGNNRPKPTRSKSFETEVEARAFAQKKSDAFKRSQEEGQIQTIHIIHQVETKYCFAPSALNSELQPA